MSLNDPFDQDERQESYVGLNDPFDQDERQESYVGLSGEPRVRRHMLVALPLAICVLGLATLLVGCPGATRRWRALRIPTNPIKDVVRRGTVRRQSLFRPVLRHASFGPVPRQARSRSVRQQALLGSTSHQARFRRVRRQTFSQRRPFVDRAMPAWRTPPIQATAVASAAEPADVDGLTGLGEAEFGFERPAPDDR